MLYMLACLLVVAASVSRGVDLRWSFGILLVLLQLVESLIQLVVLALEI